MTCSFFGHRDTPDAIETLLEKRVSALVEEGTDQFLVGNQGFFDNMVLRVLRRTQERYPHIVYYVVLAYLPSDNVLWTPYTDEETIYPDGLEKVHPRYAISWRNKWMVQKSDVVVAYVTRTYGGAARFLQYASQQNKRVINLAEREE